MGKTSPVAELRRRMRLAGMRPLPSLRHRPAIDLRGKRVLVTGASSGIGESAAKKFAALGATVIVVARREHLLDALVEHIAAQGGDAVSIPTDLSDLAAVDALVQTVGQVDILVNNAARSIRRPVAESLDRWHDFERIMAVNFYGQLRLIRGLAPGMIARGDGHIINVSSWRVLPEASPLFSVYIASKAALSAMSRIMETEWEPLGVHSTTLYYPLVATPMIAPTRAYDGLPALTSDEAAEWMITAAQTRPVRIAPRMAMAYRALDLVTPGVVNGIMQRQASKLGT